jgi:putative ABC transport system ATP-binding protein
MPPESYLRAEEITRHYRRGPHTVTALDRVTIDVRRGEFLSIVGSSGSGKTTLLNLLAGLDTPTSGKVYLEESALSEFSRRQLTSYRAHKVGMIFQSFNLIGHYTAIQNVETALLFNGTAPRERRRRATAILEKLGLADRLTHRPADLSGGEQQRVAIARAIVKEPEIVFADEPTGNLDFENAEQIVSLLTALNQEGLTVVMVTHNLELARLHARRAIRMRYGRVVPETSSAEEGPRP